MRILLLILLILATVEAQPLQIAANMQPAPAVVIPDDSYHWEAKLVADKLAELRAEKQKKIAVYFTKKEPLIKDVKIDSSDKGKYLVLSRLSFPANVSWNPEREGDGIEVLGGDYSLYNDFYISNYKDGKITIKPVYYILDLDKKVGKTIILRGEKYLVLEYNSTDKYIKLAKAKEIKLYSSSSPVEYRLWDGRGIKLVSYVKPGNTSGSAVLMPTLNGNNLGSIILKINTTPKEITEDMKEFFHGYYVYLTEAGSNYISLAFGDKSTETKIYNGESAFGYSTIWLPRTVGSHSNSLVLVGRAITLERYDTAQLEGTPYSLRTSDYHLSIAEQGLLGIFSNESTLKYRKFSRYIKNDLKILISGDKITLEYLTNELDDNTDTEDDFRATSCSTDQFLIRNCSAAGWSKEDEGLRVDGNGDGKLNSNTDYVIYNDLLVWDKRYEYVDIIPLRILTISDNSVISVGGRDYYIVDSKIPNSFTVMPAREIRLYNMAEYKPQYGKSAFGDIKFVVTDLKKSGNISFNLFLVENGNLIATFLIRNVSPGDELTDLSEYTRRKIFIKDAGTDYITLVVQTGDTKTVYADDRWLGYSKVKMGFYMLNISEVALFGEKITVKRGRIEKIPGTQFYVSYTDGKIDVLRKKKIKINPGELLSSGKWPWRDFLKSDITFFIVEEPVYPEIRIQYANKTKNYKNLILIGTPEDNSVIARLVRHNISKVNWSRSTGNIEVLNRSGIIILGGRDRKAVERAVEGFLRGAAMEYRETEAPAEIEKIKLMNSTEKTIWKNESEKPPQQNRTTTTEVPYKKQGNTGFLAAIIKEIIKFISGLLGGNK